MDNFKAIYKILSELDKAMDDSEFNIAKINHEAVGVSEERWTRYIEIMLDVGMIKGASIRSYIGGSVNVDISNIRITLKGLEYLTENSIMQRIYKAAKGIVDFVPGI